MFGVLRRLEALNRSEVSVCNGSVSLVTFAIASEARAEALVDRMDPRLPDCKIVIDMADVEVLRGDRFH